MECLALAIGYEYGWIPMQLLLQVINEGEFRTLWNTPSK